MTATAPTIAAPTDPLPGTPEGVIEELAYLRAVIDAADAARLRRREVWRAGRALTPAVPFTQLGAASGVTDVAVHQDLREKPARS